MNMGWKVCRALSNESSRASGKWRLLWGTNIWKFWQEKRPPLSWTAHQMTILTVRLSFQMMHCNAWGPEATTAQHETWFCLFIKWQYPWRDSNFLLVPVFISLFCVQRTWGYVPSCVCVWVTRWEGSSFTYLLLRCCFRTRCDPTGLGVNNSVMFLCCACESAYLYFTSPSQIHHLRASVTCTLKPLPNSVLECR